MSPISLGDVVAHVSHRFGLPEMGIIGSGTTAPRR